MENSPHYSSASFIPISSDTNELQSSSSKKYDSETFNKSRYSSNLQFNNTFFPWKKTAYTCGIVGLHEEINDFYEMIQPTAEEAEIRLKVIEHITRIVHALWPQAQVEVFGSFRTGLYLPSSDIDIVIIGEWKCLPLSTLQEALCSNGIDEEDVNIVPSASVPIVRVIHTPSKVRVDISFNGINGVKSAKFIKKLIKEYPTLPKLVLILKQFLINRRLNEVYSGGMSSYCLTLLIVSFLQGFHKPKCMPSTNLGTLLIEFFEHYGVNFNYEKVSIHFDNGGNYQPRINHSGSYLVVEDPLQAGKDVAKGSYLMFKLKEAFQNAFHLLHKAVVDSMNNQKSVQSYLHLILHLDKEVEDNRKWTQENYTGILRRISQLMQDTSNSLTFGTSSSQKSKSKKKRKSNNKESFFNDR